MTEVNHPVSKGRGGKREGAGRKKGSVTQKTREIAEKAVRDGITPLEVMLEAMREAYKLNGAAAAVPFAKDAAPYIHARIASVEHSGPNGEAVKVDAAFGLPPAIERALVELAGAAKAPGNAKALPD